LLKKESNQTRYSLLPEDFRDYLLANNFDISVVADKQGYPKLSSQVTKLLYLLADYVSKPPPEKIKVDIRPDPLPKENDINCNDGYFRGTRSKPAHIIDVILFGYELDLLEIRLFELYEVVDEIVIWEGGFSQRGDRKPLLFSRNMERFERFSDKIIHIVQDDSDIPHMANPRKENLKPGGNWGNEGRMRDHAIEGYIKYKGGETKVPENHLLITGDLDEIPPAAGIQAFKYCKSPGPTAAFYTTMYRFDLEHITPMKDWNGYWSQPMVTKIGLSYRHSRDHIVPYSLYPGAHLNRCLPPAAISFKSLCLAEDGSVPKNGDIMAEYHNRRCHWLKNAKKPAQWPYPQYVPWFAKVNPERFPYLFPSRHTEFDLKCQ